MPQDLDTASSGSRRAAGTAEKRGRSVAGGRMPHADIASDRLNAACNKSPSASGNGMVGLICRTL